MSKTILITGGAGFIGSHVVRLFANKYPDYKIVNLDKLTYAGNLENLSDIENKDNYIFEKGDIVDEGFIKEFQHKVDWCEISYNRKFSQGYFIPCSILILINIIQNMVYLQ